MPDQPKPEDIARLIERLREEAPTLSGNSFDCQNCGISSNLAYAAADALEATQARIARLEQALEPFRSSIITSTSGVLVAAPKRWRAR